MVTIVKFLYFILAVIVFNGCSEKIVSMPPKLHTIDPKTKKLRKCTITYTIQADGNVTLPLDDAMCITNKLSMSEKNCEKLRIANMALNNQIRLLNSFYKKARR